MGMTIDKAIEHGKEQLEIFGGEHEEFIETAIDTMRKYRQLEDFAKWVAIEVIDEEMWTYNHLSFAELACRKLVQLEIMQESDGEYLYEVVEDGKVD